MAQIEMAFPRCLSSRKMLVIRARVEGISVAPAMPCTPRATISMIGLVAQAQASEASANTAMPAMRSLRRPIRSPIEPMVITRPATMKP